jgi:hypothetical protein
MKRAYLICLLQSLTATLLFSQSNPVPLVNPSERLAPAIGVPQADPKAQARILDRYGKLPLSFEANQGQADGRVKFLSRTGGYSLFLTADEAVLTLREKKTKQSSPQSSPQGPAADRLRPVSGYRFSDTASSAKLDAPLGAGQRPSTSSADPEVVATRGVLRMKLRNANLAARVTGQDELAGTSNYFIGNDPAKWRTKVPTYAKVKYEGIYSGIDLVYYGNQRQLEYDFIVAPGADPRRIAFDVRGAKRIRQDAHGDLVFKVGEDEVRWHKPAVYQEKEGTRQLVAAHYAITDKNRVGFKVAEYDTSRPLYIDPLIYSTYLGGGQSDWGYGIAVDSAGSAYVTGFTNSGTFPTVSPLQPTNAGLTDAFVAKLNPKGSALVYSTYLGGSGNDWGSGIAVDSAGNAYLTGTTASSNFPTVNPLQTTGSGFLSKINATGSALVYSTYISGGGFGIAVDSAGNAYITGSGFLSKINAIGSALVYSTYISGGGSGVAVDSAGNAYVADGALLKVNASGALLYSFTLAGGTTVGIAVDSAGNAYTTGYTYSTSFPTTAGAFQTVCNGGSGCSADGDAFVSKLNAAGSALIYSTYLGGKGHDSGAAIAVDSAGNAYVTGLTWAYDFPTKDPLQSANAGVPDAFVTKLNASGSALVYSTYFGGNHGDAGSGIALDSAANVYITGETESTNFPVKFPLQKTCGGGSTRCRYGDAFVTKIDVKLVTTTTLSSSPNPSAYGQPVSFTAVVTSSVGAPPDGETVTFMKGTNVLGTGTLSGGSASFTTSALTVGTNFITAVYGGDSNLGGSKSKGVNQVVDKATTTTTLTSSLNPSSFGQSVTFTASVAPQFSGTVKGTVTFYDGATALKTVGLSGGVAKYTTSALTVGAHTITSTYNGNTSFDSSSASLTQTVN